MFNFIKKFFSLSPEEKFFRSKEFHDRFNAMLQEKLSDRPYGYTLDAIFNTNEDVKAWVIKNKTSITEEQYFSVLQQHIDTQAKRRIPNDAYFMLRDVDGFRQSFEPINEKK